MKLSTLPLKSVLKEKLSLELEKLLSQISITKKEDPVLNKRVKEFFVILVEEKGDLSFLFRLSNTWGRYLHRILKYTEAEVHLKKSLMYATELNDSEFLSLAHNRLGVLYTEQRKVNDGLHHQMKALAYSSSVNKIRIYIEIGVLYLQNLKFDRSLNFFQKALEAAKFKQPKYLLHIYIHMGTSLQSLERFSEAIDNYELALSLMDDSPQHEQNIACCIGNIGAIKLKLEHYDESLEYSKKAIELYKKYNNFRQEIYCIATVASVYTAQKKYDAANNILLDTLQKIIEFKYITFQEPILSLLILNSKKSGDLEMCIEYQNQLISFMSKYFHLENKEKIEDILNQKEGEIDVLIEKNIRIGEQNQKLVLYNKELEQYAFIIAHDLKEPLCNISGFVSLLKEEYKQILHDSGMQGFLEYIELGTQQMHHLLEDLLKYSTLQIESTKVETVHLQTIIDSVLSQKLDLITTQQASIHIQNSLPLLDAEPKHLEWLLSQIIGNALKFKDRSKPVQIEIRTYEKNEKTYVEVKDNGIGIQKIQQKKIFRIFQRLNKVDYKGTGIGLAMCKKIVEMYGGEIGLQSKEGVGTKVYFHLPSAVFS